MQWLTGHSRSVLCLALNLWLIFGVSEWAQGETREWVSVSGARIEAELVSHSGDSVVLRAANGETFMIRESQLSEGDRDFLRERHWQETDGPILTSRTSDASSFRDGTSEGFASLSPGRTVERTAEGETGITYHVYTPTGFDPENPGPIIVAFSPSGNGRGMVNRFRESAEQLNWIVVGCDELRNNMPSDSPTDKMTHEVLDDIFKYIPHRADRIILAGFSGGGSRCFMIAREGYRPESIVGIISMGGWMGERYNDRYQRGMVVAQVNGEDDRGARTWTRRDASALGKNRCKAREFVFPGGHVMPPTPVLLEAIAWMRQEWGDVP